MHGSRAWSRPSAEQPDEVSREIRENARMSLISRLAPMAVCVSVLTALLVGPPAPAASAASAREAAVARASAVSWAVDQVGHRERGTTNCSPRVNRWTKAMGFSLPPCRPWCGAFVHQAFLEAGVRLSARLIDPDRSYEDALAGRRGLRRIAVTSVRKGDLLFFAFRPRLKASHLAIVLGRPQGGFVDTVEGNVEHAVRLKKRGLRYPVLAARVVVP